MTDDRKATLQRMMDNVDKRAVSGRPCGDFDCARPELESELEAAHLELTRLRAQVRKGEREIARLRELAFNIAKAAVPEWKREFERAVMLEEKLSALSAKSPEVNKNTPQPAPTEGGKG